MALDTEFGYQNTLWIDQLLLATLVKVPLSEYWVGFITVYPIPPFVSYSQLDPDCLYLNILDTFVPGSVT